MLARVTLGHSDLSVHPIGLGCMGMSQSYGATDDDASTATIRAALDLGVDFLDTSDVYGASDITWDVPIRGFGHNEKLIGRAIEVNRSGFRAHLLLREGCSHHGEEVRREVQGQGGPTGC